MRTTLIPVAPFAVPLLDPLERPVGSIASRATPVAGGAAFWLRGGDWFLDARDEPGAWTARVGRLELVVDLAHGRA